MSDLSEVATLFAPLLVSLVFHGICMRLGWLRRLAIAIDGDVHIGGRRLFGANKTLRGIIAVALGSGFGYTLQALAGRQAGPLRELPLVGMTLFGFAIGTAA